MSKGDVGNAVDSIGEVRVTPAPRFAKFSALLVGAVLGLIAVVLITTASKGLKQVNTVPERTIETMKENVQWAKNQIK